MHVMRRMNITICIEQAITMIHRNRMELPGMVMGMMKGQKIFILQVWNSKRGTSRYILVICTTQICIRKSIKITPNRIGFISFHFIISIMN